MMNEHYTLRQLNLLVREAIEDALPDEYWVEAELSECRENSGHCYMELIEKDERSNTPVARASAKCWRQTWLMVKPYFERTTVFENNNGVFNNNLPLLYDRGRLFFLLSVTIGIFTYHFSSSDCHFP